MRATDRGDNPRARCWPHEGLDPAAIQRLDGPAARHGKLLERSQIAGVTLERVIGQPALDAEMIEVRVDHGGMLPFAVRPRFPEHACPFQVAVPSD